MWNVPYACEYLVLPKCDDLSRPLHYQYQFLPPSPHYRRFHPPHHPLGTTHTHTHRNYSPDISVCLLPTLGEREEGGLLFLKMWKRPAHDQNSSPPPRGFWSMSRNAMPRTEEMLTKRCEQPWSRDGWSRERRGSEHVSSNTNSRAHQHVFRNINESALHSEAFTDLPIDAVITNVYHCFTAFLFDSTLCNKPKKEVVTEIFGNLLFKRYIYMNSATWKKKDWNSAFFI